MRRTIFYLSDGTGITAETIGHSVLTQFDDVAFDTFRVPFIDDEEKAHGAAARIRNAYATTGARPIVVIPSWTRHSARSSPAAAH